MTNSIYFMPGKKHLTTDMQSDIHMSSYKDVSSETNVKSTFTYCVSTYLILLLNFNGEY